MKGKKRVKQTYKQKKEERKSKKQIVKTTFNIQEHTKKLTHTKRKKREKNKTKQNKQEPEKKTAFKLINISIVKN